ncbi:MAG TPA: ISL3 family transposase [Phycisphaerae bacterium]|nr:ISL3 family transposase [Phycisphaerae bacterium]
MSTCSIAAYFPFRRVRIAGQSVAAQADLAMIDVVPDERFRPICHACGRQAGRIQQREVRAVRDLNFGSARVILRCTYRKVWCRQCSQVVVEDLELFDPYRRVTRRLARAIHELCKVMTVSDVARHFGLNWKTVKNIDKAFLEDQYGQTDYEGLRLLAVDEIAIKKGQQYMTVVIDHITGRVVWMGTGRKKETLDAFFAGMSDEQKARVEAVAMDMWRPYIKSVSQAVPDAKIVFDLYHVVASFNKVIDAVRLMEFRAASKEYKGVYKGAKFLLLKRRIRRKEHREHLASLLRLNETLLKMVVLRDQLPRIWGYHYRGCAARALDDWCGQARTIDHPDVTAFVRMLESHREGILNHCDYPIHTSKLEGINNKIKVIKRDAYGYHDERYFSLKVKQAFDPNCGN